MSKFNVGDKVKYIGKGHNELPEFYPAIGTIGVIDRIDKDGNYWVQWPKGTTSNNDCWCCSSDNIEQVIEDMTNEEIWKMLQPKLLKNYIFPNNVSEAVGMAYRVGYLRAMKGRPFKIGEKKKKGGHWEPVDPNNLPKEGSMVRYSRECKEYSNYKIPLVAIGDLGKVDITTDGWFGIRLDNPRSFYSWLSFDNNGNAACLDMWMEDDE